MFRIGEFSKIAQVSGRLLRYYDELGLLKPIHIDRETGYRYYSVQQLPELNRILALKEMGLTLDQIARLLADKISPDEIRGMLILKKAQIEQTVRDELVRFRYIESRIAQIDREGALSNYEVILKSIPSQRIVGIQEISTNVMACRVAAQEMSLLLADTVTNRALGNFVVVVHSELWDLDDLDVDMGFVFHGTKDIQLKLSNGLDVQVRELPAVELMATTVRVGLSELGHGSYAAIGHWAEANGYHLSGSPREVFHTLAQPGRENDTLAEIQIPLERTPLPPSSTFSLL